MSSGGEELGPLPGTDDNDERERASLAALEAALPRALFRLRSEPGRDQGVDRFIEVLADGHDTNLRAHVQAKSCRTARDNADGSISETIDTSNFNYMLNGHCPIYVLWIDDRQELRFTWARDEFQRISKANTNWQSQDTVTLRFTRRVRDCIDEIRHRIIVEGRLHRSIHEALARHTLAEPATLQFDASVLELTDAAVALDRLNHAGISLVAAGFGEQVLSIVNVLGRQDRVTPRICLIVGYAHFVRDRFHLARGELAEAKLRESELNDNDRLFLDRLLNACDWELCHISEAEYDERESNLLDRGGPLLRALQELDHVRFDHLRERNRTRANQLLDDLRAIADQIALDAQSPRAAQFSAQAALLYCEGHQLVNEYLAQLAQHLIPSPWETSFSVAPRIIGSSQFHAWFQRVQDLVHRGDQSMHPIAVADAIYTLSASLCAMLAMIRGTEQITGQPHGDAGPIEALVERSIRQAVAGFERVSSLRSTLLARLVEADVLDIAGQDARCHQIASEVERAARIMLYGDIQAFAADILAGRSAYRRMIEELSRSDEQTDDEHHAGVSDGDLRGMAVQFAERFGLPPERASNIERALVVQRRMSQERLSWCRHIEMLTNLEHENSQNTMYREFPPHACHCRQFDDLLVEGGENWEEALDTFKARHCSTCTAREPARESPQNVDS